MRVDLSDARLAEIVSRNPAAFDRYETLQLIGSDKLNKLSISDLLTLRAPQLVSLKWLALAFTFILLIRLLLNFFQIWILQYTGQRVMYDMRQEIFTHVMRLPARFFDKNPVGRIVTRATNDVSAINEMYTAVLVYLFKDFFVIGGVFLIMLQLNWQLGLMILLTAPLIVWVTWEFRKRARDAYRDFRRKLAKLNAYLQESLSGMRIIQLFAQESRSTKTFNQINQEEYQAIIRQMITFAVFQPIIHFLSVLTIALIVWYGGGNVLSSALSLGALVAFISYVEMMFAPIRDLAEKYNILQGAMASSERIFMLLDEKPEAQNQGQTLPEFRGSIEFRDVWFAYESEEWVLRGVSFKVSPGERVAIVGPTGSGKTTIISLVLRLYDIQKGQILIDGRDIRELNLHYLRSQMAVVLQDVFLFSGDILGNIRLQNDKITETQAMAAASFVEASSFIQKLPQAYRSEVKERGATLSAGQRQLLAFARAVAFNPKILVLDEATANIDSQTEGLIQRSLNKLMQDRTSLVIAHRLSTIRNSDNILVLHHGQLVEQGTHTQLMGHKGLYHALYTLQFAEEQVQANTLLAHPSTNGS
jgi:ABC-type multidrug transport system fused ATPase/permease subunit